MSLRENTISAIRDLDDCGSDLAAAYADAAIAAMFAELETPSEEMVINALDAAGLDGEVYHISDFQEFVKAIAAHLKR